MRSPLTGLGAGALLVVLALAGCATATTPEPPSVSDGSGDDGAADDDGRVFDSTDDAVVMALEAALSSQNAHVEWQGTTVVVTLDGSTSSATAYLPCTAAEGVIAEGEDAVLRYPDGELICADRPR